MMLFTLNVCIFKNWIAKIKESANVDVTCECTFKMEVAMGGNDRKEEIQRFKFFSGK